MNWTELLSTGRFPSPLIVESENALEFIRLYASHAFCESSTFCKNCAGCKKVAKSFHPDWIQLNSGFSISELRDALYQLRKRPFEARYRILSLEQLDPTQVQAQNALLKTLEEPQASWLLLIGTTSASQLLPTIRSRCLKIKWKAVAEMDWNDSDEKLFSAIERKESFEVQVLLETVLKGRDSAYESFRVLLRRASERGYPGHWMALAPALEPSLAELQRNLNQKIVWDKAWAQSLI